MDNSIVVLITALFGGAIASIIAGYFARPKTKADAEQANANANVQLSADAREWAQLWMKKSEQAEERAHAAEAKAQQAEDKVDEADLRIDNLETDLSACIAYLRAMQAEITRLNGNVPPPPEALRRYWEGGALR